MSTSLASSTAGADGEQLVKVHYDALVAVLDRLDDPTERWAPWTIAEGPPLEDPLARHVKGYIKQWRRAGLLERAPQFADVRDCEHGQPVRFTPEAVQSIERHMPGSVELPCGHHGFKNLREGDYTCAVEWCEAECTRAELEAAMEA